MLDRGLSVARATWLPGPGRRGVMPLPDLLYGRSRAGPGVYRRLRNHYRSGREQAPASAPWHRAGPPPAPSGPGTQAVDPTRVAPGHHHVVTVNSGDGYRPSHSSARTHAAVRSIEVAAPGCCQRVVMARGLPDLSNLPHGQMINIKRVLKLRDLPGCPEMRKWLREIDSETDAEISERLTSFREGLAAATHTQSSKHHAVRDHRPGGMLPRVGLPAGLGATAADYLIIEKLIGPLTWTGSASAARAWTPGSSPSSCSPGPDPPGACTRARQTP